jgi:hypothetical protein
MLKLAVVSIIALIYLLLFVSFQLGLMAWWERHNRRRRLKSSKDKQYGLDLISRFGSLTGPYRHLADLLAALRWRMTPSGFLVFSIGMGLLGIASGVMVFQSFRAAFILLAILSCCPYLMLRLSLLNRQMATRLEFLPAVELFYQSYLVTGCRHIRIALQKTIEERRLPGEIQAVFEQLYRNLSVSGDDEESLRWFTLSLGNVWSDYFGSLLRVSLEEGNNVADNLKELITDMRKAQMANQLERHRLLEIRMANFAPVLFLALFLGINFRLNPKSSYEYYLLDAAGREMLLNAVILLFGSLVMGLNLSRRKI